VALDYLTVADVLGMHTVLMQRYGGLPGVRDPGALEAALYRPQTGYYKDTIEQAAALMESLAINHPFVDGNKRIAFAATDVFLRINGFKLNRKPSQIYAEIISMLDNRQLTLVNVDAWLRGFTSERHD
jgi:death-on-curing protein